MRVVSAELDLLLMEPLKEYITMVVLVTGSIPLLYFLNREWYETLMFTGFGKALLAVCAAVIFISVAAVAKHTRPIEYKRCWTDFADIQNKKECGGNRQWQRRFLRN